MRRLIRNDAGLYWKEDGSWTSDWEEAESFGDTHAAISAKERYHLKGVALVLLVSDKPSAQYDVVLPLNDAKP
jgi:hypothetical protein